MKITMEAGMDLNHRQALDNIQICIHVCFLFYVLHRSHKDGFLLTNSSTFQSMNSQFTNTIQESVNRR